MSIIGEARFNFHHRLLEAKTLALTKSLVASNADVGSKLSVSVAGNLLRILAMQHDYPLVGGDKSVGQNLGKMFERLTAEFLRATFLRMQDLRPGAWTVQLLGNSGRSALCNFAQYEHLAYIKEVTSKDPKLAAALGVDYVVSPDIVIYREPESDAVLCAKLGLVDNSVGLLSSFRNQRGDRRPCLHASVSAKCFATICLTRKTWCSGKFLKSERQFC